MRSSVRAAALAVGVASFIALLEIHRVNLTRLIDAGPATSASHFHRVFTMWLMVVVISPWCAFMARRFPFRPGRWVETLAAHAMGGAVFVAMHLVLMLTFHYVVTGEARLGGFRLLHMYAFYILLEMSVYAGIVIVILLLDARREASERAVTAARLEQGLTSARLVNLQSQIRPHFLFNTLNALAVLARRGDGPAVDKAIGDLGELLRTSFDTDGRHEIPLGEELEFLERYVSLQRIRFPDRLEVEWRIDDEARRAWVPTLVVQPLVENALEHGLDTARGGHVRVAARRDGEVLEVEVSDDGPGFGVMSSRAGGVGLANTRERLELLYGTQGTLVCGERPGGGGLVRIRIPWRTGAAVAQA